MRVTGTPHRARRSPESGGLLLPSSTKEICFPENENAPNHGGG
jgi:hypothetical protein